MEFLIIGLFGSFVVLLNLLINSIIVSKNLKRKIIPQLLELLLPFS